MEQSVRRYMKGMTVREAVNYLRRTWGAYPHVAVDMVPTGAAEVHILVHVEMVAGPAEYELNFPPSTTYAAIIRQGTRLERTIVEGLILWAQTLEEHLAAANSPE